MAKTKTAASPKTTTAKKTESKKATPSAHRASASTKKPAVRRAEPGHEFYLVDGRTIADIKELADALDAMADHVWMHHVTAEKNDFASWIEGVFEEAELATRVRAAAGKHHAQVVIYRHILEQA